MTSDPGGKINVRELGPDGVGPFRAIDRSEHIDTLCTFEDGRLRRERVDFEVPPWDSDGHGDHSSARRITEFRWATPSGSAVGCYTSRGCRLATPPHPALLAKEPDDLYLIWTADAPRAVPGLL